jgi:hypothetical protein
MATPARSFIDTYNNEITELKRHFMGYVKALRASDIASRSAAQGDSMQIRLEMTSDGFPILPTPWKGSQYKKKELEEWFKLYVGQHYSMITSFSMSCYLSACRTSEQWSYSPCPIHSTRRAHIDIHQS